VTVGNGGWAAHSNFRTARARGRPLMSENRWCEFRDEYVKSAAYHEAGHVVVAALQGMPLQEAGIRVDSEGSGVSHYWHRCPGDHATAPSDQLERERTIIALHAGRISQTRYLGGADCPENAWASDNATICKLLEEMQPTGVSARRRADAKLRCKAEEIVSNNWEAIKCLAEAVLGKTPQPQADQSGCGRKAERRMSGSEVKKLLEEFGICATVQQ